MLGEILIDSVVPWILGTLLSLVVFTSGMSLKSWRDIKRSPYFFLRRQAEKNLQTYLSSSLVLMFITVGVTVYAWQTPQDTTARVAILTNSKPPSEEIVELIESSPTRPDLLETAQSLLANSTNSLVLADTSSESAVPTLPAEYDRFEPTAELNPDTALGTLSFSTEINDEYEAVEPRRIFPEGSYMLYATFSYDDMADGMVWAWIWRHDGEVVDGGNEVWNYGDDGPGYIYFNPETGFAAGEYSLEVWVNGELLTRSSVVMNNAAVSAGN